MFEIDYLPVGDEGQSGDAIAGRFTTSDGVYRHIVVDAGFQDDGEALVEHVNEYYGTRRIDLAIVTHPDGDHIGGMGAVIRDLDVGVLCIHRLGQRGGPSLPAADAVDELIELAESEGTAIHEPFAGDSGFGGVLRILGPTEDWYEELVTEQVREAPARAARRAPSRLAEALRAAGQHFLNYLPVEVQFDDAGGTNPRNNSSVVTLLVLDGTYRILLTGDAGVPALDRAWDYLDVAGLDNGSPDLMQVPHAGSRHNASSALLNRILGPPGQEPVRKAQVSVASRSTKHPSPRVANAYMRRGCGVYETRGSKIWHHSADAPSRNWGDATPLQPMDESAEDD